MNFKVITDIQIRFADADILGHINNVNIQHYFDLGKFRYYNEVFGDMLDWHGQTLVLVSVKTDMFRQTRLDDSVFVETSIEKIGNKSITVFQRLVNRTNGECNAECRSVAVGFDMRTQVSIPIRDDWRLAVEALG